MFRKGIFPSVFLYAVFSGVSQANAGLILSEVMYDPSSSDDGYEWVELFNNSANMIDLSDFSLGWGGSDYTYGTMQLGGSVASGDYFVIGGPSSGSTMAIRFLIWLWTLVRESRMVVHSLMVLLYSI